MKIKLEELNHQKEALKHIIESFPEVDRNNSDNNKYANPIVQGYDKNENNEKLNVDIKMETGTGKTYVYTRMMYELYERYKLFKFIIAVPSPAIKEQAKNFITADFARQHFAQFYENANIQLNVLNKGDFNSRSGRKNFPPQLSNFVNSTNQESNQIQVLLINSGMLTSKNMTEHIDQTLLGYDCPMDALAATRPIVIIDEPHRFKRPKSGKNAKRKTAYEVIEGFIPQVIVRFGATFPEVGSGKIKRVDYYRDKPQFDLNAVDSFNQGLVKGIDVYYPDLPEGQANNVYTVEGKPKKELTLSQNGRKYTIMVGENLADIDENFAGNITYQGSGMLSSDLELKKGMKLIPGTFATTYQERIIKQAIDRHFEAERHNFMRPNNAPKVKTLSLYFIDSIYSFRGEDGKKGWLAEKFEDLLAVKLNEEIKAAKDSDEPRSDEYADFLQATLSSLKSDHQNVYAGYFSQDNSSKDEDIQKQIDDILRNKEKLLSFKDKNGKWLTRRFLFSKWTLREGWDNPNVFVIAKLRTSGSETSKIQEVGRGLRLPVDEAGQRLTQKEHSSRLSFLIGYDEKDFAKKLIGEVNCDAKYDISEEKLTDDMITLAVQNMKRTEPEYTSDKLKIMLGRKNIIDEDKTFCVDEKGKKVGYKKFCELFPAVIQKYQVQDDKVRNIEEIKNHKNSPTVRLCTDNWEQLKKFWQQLAIRKMVVYSDNVNEQAKKIAQEVFDNDDNFVIDYQKIIRQEVTTKKEEKTAGLSETTKQIKTDVSTMVYGKFLKQLAINTSLSVKLLHQLVVNALSKKEDANKFINERVLNNLSSEFNKQFNHVLRENFSYRPLKFYGNTSIYDAKTGKFVEEVSAALLGVYSDQSNEDKAPKYLYDRPPLRYDSEEPEKKILEQDYSDDSKVIVFGKLPKQAIKIPRYDKGTTTPDFIFKIKQKSGKNVYLIVETKAENMREGDEAIRVIQEKYFNSLKESGVYYQLATSSKQVIDKINQLEEEN